MKKLLYISYNFPPVGGGRVRRTLKFVKYLKDFDWLPIVLTVKRPAVPEYDISLMEEIPKEIRVVRTNSFNFAWIKKLRGNTRKSIYNKKKSKLRIMLEKVEEKIKWSIFIPDIRIAWIPFAVRKGLKIIKKEDIKAIFVSGEPFSSFFSGIFLKKITGIPLIIEFRDEWCEFNDYFSFRTKPRWVKKLEEKMEKWSVEQSDKVISVTETIVDNFKKRYPYLNHDRFVCITNGYDQDDFKDLIGEKRTDKFVITYAGALRSCRTPKFLFEAIEDWIEEEPWISNQLNFTYLGICEPDTQYLFEREKIKKVADIIGFVSFKSTLNYLKNSDILIYLEDQIEIADRVCPSKLFEYIAIGRPILALAEGISVREVIQKSNTGIVVSPRDVKKIKQALKSMFFKYKRGRLTLTQNGKYIKRFERRYLTSQLATVLDQV